MKILVDVAAPQEFNGTDLHGLMFDFDAGDLAKVRRMQALFAEHQLSDIRIMFYPCEVRGRGDCQSVDVPELCVSSLGLHFTAEEGNSDIQVVSPVILVDAIEDAMKRGVEVFAMLGANRASADEALELIERFDLEVQAAELGGRVVAMGPDGPLAAAEAESATPAPRG